MDSLLVVIIFVVVSVIIIGILKFYKQKELKEQEEIRRREESIRQEELRRQEELKQEELRNQEEYEMLEKDVLKKLDLLDLEFNNMYGYYVVVRPWTITPRYYIPYHEENVIVKSRQALQNYDKIKFFKENSNQIALAEEFIKRKKEIVNILKQFIENNDFKLHRQYERLEKEFGVILYYAKKTNPYQVRVKYISYAGNTLAFRILKIGQRDIDRLRKDPSLLMGKAEYSKFLREQQKEELQQKHQEFYKKVNTLVDYANEHRETLFVKDSREKLDGLMVQLYDRTVNSIKKIKTLDSEEWDVIDKFITYQEEEVEKIVGLNQRILAYYRSSDFNKIKNTCEALMGSQKEFNEYIAEKVESISKFFGVRVVRNETINDDTYNYIRPYRKTITPFTAELSATVFASAENNPMEYIVKNFYPNKELYPEQIQKLCRLVEELQTLREAQKIIENYKAEYHQYIKDVPAFVMENDETGFYSRLGFANIDESVLTVEYKFCYTSGGGMAKRSFDVPMTEETIAELIKVLESKLTIAAFVKEQRILMTKKLRESIKKRDNYTCCQCGNSIQIEPNLLLEIDHIIPLSKGGYTVEDNLQTLCWKCNRAKSDKLNDEYK